MKSQQPFRICLSMPNGESSIAMAILNYLRSWVCTPSYFHHRGLGENNFWSVNSAPVINIQTVTQACSLFSTRDKQMCVRVRHTLKHTQTVQQTCTCSQKINSLDLVESITKLYCINLYILYSSHNVNVTSKIAVHTTKSICTKISEWYSLCNETTLQF